MLRSFDELSEIIDAQTRAKRKNRLLLYGEAEREDAAYQYDARIKAMMDLKPLFPWTDRLKQSSFVQITTKKRSKGQIDDTKAKINALMDFESDATNEKLSMDPKPYAGRGNEAHDLDNAISMSHQIQNNRLLEKTLVENANNTMLTSAIKNLRPDIDKTSYVSNLQLNRMTLSQKAEYLIETLGESIANIEANM